MLFQARVEPTRNVEIACILKYMKVDDNETTAALPRGSVTSLTDHPLRVTLSNEVHARPFELLSAPVQATHLALMSLDETLADEYQLIGELCQRYNSPVPNAGAKHFSVDLDGMRLKWERHSEFSSYTFFLTHSFDKPFETTAISYLPEAWLQRLPGELLMAAHVAIEGSDQHLEIDDLAQFFSRNTVAGAQVAGGAAQVWTDFRIHGDGFSRILIQDKGLMSRQAGRLVQRLCEIEEYRMLALLALPLAQSYGQKLKQMESALSQVTASITEISELADERRMLDSLTRLAADVESISSTTSYRFSAARAYHEIILRRIDDLRETRIEGMQTLNEFMERRLLPAMQTCLSVEQRIQALAQRVTRASNLLRTRVDISMEEQSRDLLLSMDRRAHLQLQLQETVEGLSVVVLSYYLLGILGYGLKALKSLGLAVNVELATGIAIPVVAGVVYLGVKQLKRLVNH